LSRYVAKGGPGGGTARASQRNSEVALIEPDNLCVGQPHYLGRMVPPRTGSGGRVVLNHCDAMCYVFVTFKLIMLAFG
jgi:hypothetical protein